MKFATALAFFPPAPSIPDPIVHYAQAADRVGFESIWVPEHVAIPHNYQTRYPYRPEGKLPGDDEDMNWPEPLMCLDLRCRGDQKDPAGTIVIILPLRHPLYIAKEMATLDVLSKGRANLASGADGSRRNLRRWDSTSTFAANAPTSRSRQSGRCGATTRRAFPANISTSPRSRAFPSRCNAMGFRSLWAAFRPPRSAASRAMATAISRSVESRSRRRSSIKSRRNASGLAGIRPKSNYAADASRRPTRSGAARTSASSAC